MVFLKGKKQSGQSIVEYMLVFVLVVGVLIVFGKYVSRAMNGRWKQVGDMWSYSKQYDPDLTIECSYDMQYLDIWYDRKCFEQNCAPAPNNCWIPRFFLSATQQTTCRTCIQNCHNIRPECST